MAAITLPVINQETATMGLQRNMGVTALLSGKEFINVQTGSRWLYSFSLGNLDEDEILEWSASLLQLSDLRNWFLAGPPGYSGAAYGGAAPLVSGAGQVGKVLNVDGATPSVTLLRKGEYFEVNGELKQATADCSSSGGGTATINFEPELKTPPPDNTVLDLATPKGKFRLADPTFALKYKPPYLADVSISCIEPDYA